MFTSSGQALAELTAHMDTTWYTERAIAHICGTGNCIWPIEFEVRGVSASHGELRLYAVTWQTNYGQLVAIVWAPNADAAAALVPHKWDGYEVKELGSSGLVFEGGGDLPPN